MAPGTRESAVIVRIQLPPGLERLRRVGTAVATLGVPAHVTLLYPFVPADTLGPSIRRALVEIARDVAPFDVRFGRVARFPGVLYLVPEPAEPFRALTSAVAARWPDHPPYGGTIAVDDVIPHLSIAETDPERAVAPDGSIAGVSAAAIAARLPVVGRVRALEVVAEDATRRWHTCWRIALGEEALRR